MKIRGNTVGTPIKPEKAVVKCENLTEEEKAQARANIGAAAVGEVGGGLTTNAKVLLSTLLSAAVYDKSILPNPAQVIEALLEELSNESTDPNTGVYEEDSVLYVVSGVLVETNTDYLVIS